MAREFFREWQPKSKARMLVNVSNGILEELSAYRLTLRQLYYQLVTRNVIANSEREYRTLSRVITRARLAALVDWDAIEDRIRQPISPPEFGSLSELVDAALASYRLPRWRGQLRHIELWVEKDALASVLRPLAMQYHVTLMVNRGYASASSMYESAMRFASCGLEHDDPSMLLYLGDHDPSGEDMVRDIRARFCEFGLVDVEIRKLALTMDQVEDHKLPPNPAKLTDPRAADYIAEHGGSSWELDALHPAVLEEIVSDAIDAELDLDLMNEVRDRELKDKLLLRKAAAEIARGGNDDSDK